MTETKKELAKTGTKVPAYIKDTGVARGSENVGIDDMVIPTVNLIQGLSKQKVEGHAKYIEGAKEGDLFNSVTDRIYGTELLFCPVTFKMTYCIFKDRADRKAKAFNGPDFLGAFSGKEEAVKYLAQQPNNEFYVVTDVAEHYGVVHNADGTMDAVCVQMSKTKMRASRQLNTLINVAGGDRFSRVYSIAGVQDQNPSGDLYYNYKVKVSGFPSEVLYKRAVELYEMVEASGVKSNGPEQEGLAANEVDEKEPEM